MCVLIPLLVTAVTAKKLPANGSCDAVKLFSLCVRPRAKVLRGRTLSYLEVRAKGSDTGKRLESTKKSRPVVRHGGAPVQMNGVADAPVVEFFLQRGHSVPFFVIAFCRQ